MNGIDGIIEALTYNIKELGIDGVIMLLIVFGGLGYLFFKLFIQQKKTKAPTPYQVKNLPESPYRIDLQLHPNDTLSLNNPFRGILVMGGNGSGKSESIAVPLIQQFISKGFSGLIYDYKFPELATDAESFLRAQNCDLRHFYLNLREYHKSNRINPIQPEYIPNTSYAREYSISIISNLIRESITKPDFWTRSATDLLTACIWYLREERPEICDLPHVLAMITSPTAPLLECLRQNPQTEQMTVSMYDALVRGSEGQLSGVTGTLQSAIAQINTPELMYIFSGSDFDLNLNDPQNPALLTVGTFPTLAQTFAPLCSLVITVATKLMNQPNKRPSFILIDELPTLYVPNLEQIPNTGRSNKIATVLMMQDYAQLADAYGKDKADVLFASCNNHFYGRVASSKTAELLSRQFGKNDVAFNSVTVSSSTNASLSGGSRSSSRSTTTSIQERDVVKPSEFLNLDAGQFIGITVESNRPQFNRRFKMAVRPVRADLPTPPRDYLDANDYYRQVRQDVKDLLS